jgi:SAM-dependent methyltransferase
MALTSFERWWLNAWPHRWQVWWHVPRFLRACPEPFRGEVLEVGAGSGWTSRQILETFPQVELTAVDRDPRVVPRFAKLQQHYGQRLHVVQADATQLPFDRAAFDIVLAINVMHHLPDPTPVCREVLRVARPGGLIGISDHYHLWRSSAPQRAELEQLLQAEQCEILFARGERQYDLWVRKAYPLHIA